jgi:hypothetical protein
MRLTNSIGLYGVILTALSFLTVSCSKSASDLPQLPYFEFSLNNTVVPVNSLSVDTTTVRNSIFIYGEALLPGMVDSAHFVAHFMSIPGVPASLALGAFADSANPSQMVEINLSGKIAATPGATFAWVNRAAYYPSIINITSNNTYSFTGTFQSGLVPDSVNGNYWPAGLDSLKLTNGTFYIPL